MSASASVGTQTSTIGNINIQVYPYDAIFQQRRNRAILARPYNTLKAKTQDCILRNKQFFSKLAKLNPGSNPFERISNTMKKELLEKDSSKMRCFDPPNDSFEVVCHVTQLLLNKKITSFNIPNNFSKVENLATSTDLCQRLLAEQLPDLHTLTSWSQVHDDYGDTNLLVSNILDVFSHIEVLKFPGYVFSDTELCRVANQLPKLRVLNVGLSTTETTREGISALSNLKTLEEFLFWAYPNTHICHHAWLGEMMLLCFELIPDLHYVCYKPKEDRDLFRKAEMTVNALASLGTQQRTLKLHGLALYQRCSIPAHIAFPELQNLCLISPMHFTTLDSERFPKLSELAFYDIRSHNHIMGIIDEEFGQQLSHLDLEATAIIQLDKLLEECPNLSMLQMRVKGVSSSSQLQPHTLQRLKMLVLRFADSGLQHQPDLLIDLLQLAPKLYQVDIKFQVNHHQLIKQLSLLAKQRNWFPQPAGILSL